MTRLLTALIAVALFAGFAPLRAEDKKDPKDDKAKPTGIWAKEADGLKLLFDFSKADIVIVTAAVGENALILTSKYKVEKDGLIKATTTKIEVMGEFPVKPKDGYNFEFKIKIDGKKARISDFGANEEADKGKEVVEGEYEKEEKKDK